MPRTDLYTFMEGRSDYMPKAVIYARYSCSKQREASIEDQLRVCRAWCLKEGYDIVAEYCDRAASGRSDARPEFQRMVENAGESDVVVVYMMDRYVVGGFYRMHAERGVDENLNAPGASFVPLAFEHSTHMPQPGVRPGVSAPNRFYMYGVVGRLAMLAASYELEATNPDAEVYD